ncbi:MAG: hypothetical protein LBD13_05520 [Spirochaetaceae bacterium]|jgi:hypothetical protein|nr:hypothetical protein [Spirochaetaceae bacterium]
MALSIASAFRLRNKLKGRIRRLTRQIDEADVTKYAGAEEYTAVFDGKTFRETVAQVGLLMNTLRDFNIAVDKANLVNKEDLITLETLKAEIAFYEGLTKKLRDARAFSYEDNPSGGKDKIALELVLDQGAVVTHLETLRKRKEGLEEKLGASNFSVTVDFDQNAIEKLL